MSASERQCCSRRCLRQLVLAFSAVPLLWSAFAGDKTESLVFSQKYTEVPVIGTKNTVMMPQELRISRRDRMGKPGPAREQPMVRVLIITTTLNPGLKPRDFRRPKPK